MRVLSTLNKPNIITKCICRIGNRRVEVETPSTAASYSRYYSVVNKYDRLCSHKVYGSLGHGSSKVWKHFCGNSQIWPLQMQELAKQLIGGFSSCKKVSSSCPTLSTNVQINMSGHQLVRMPCKRPQRCIVHSKFQPNKHKRKETVYGCCQCNSHFCHNCFHLAHCSQSTNTSMS